MIRNFFFGFFDVWKFSDELIETFNQFHRKPLSQYPAPSAQPTDATINRKLHKLKPLLNMVNSWSAKLPKCFGFPRLHRTINSRNNYRIINAINQKVHDIIRFGNWLEAKLFKLQLHIRLRPPTSAVQGGRFECNIREQRFSHIFANCTFDNSFDINQAEWIV